MLSAAGMAAPEVNRRLAGEEADLIRPARRQILEIDVPQFHRDPLEDERKQGAWRADGWELHRIPSDLVFDQPEALVSRAIKLERPPTRA